MNDNPMRDVFVDDIFTDEPPIGSIVADSTQRGLALRRRRRYQAITAGLAGVAVIAIGIPLAVGGLTGSHAGGPSTAAATATRDPLAVPTTQSTEQPPPPPPGFSLPLPTPSVPAQHLTGDQVPVTAKSVVQLLIDVLPPSITKTSHYLGNANEGAGVAMAALRTDGPTGSGSVQVVMTGPGAPALSCAEEQFHSSNGLVPSVACQIFPLSDGVSVIESVTGAQLNGGWSYFYTVGVRRADGSIVKLSVANYDVTTGLKELPSAQLPLTMDQTLAAATDARWALTADRSFVEGAAHIKIGIFA